MGRPMDARERALWEDAEGSIIAMGIGEKGRARIETVQKSPDILEDYCAGARADGIKCTIWKQEIKPTRSNPNGQTLYRTCISRLDDVAREIKLTEPWRRGKQEQIERFRRFLMQERKRVKKSLRIAREIMGISDEAIH